MDSLPQAFEGLTEDTKDIVIRATKDELTEALKSIAPDVNALSPPLPLILNCFKLTPVEKVRVVLIGQDPYIKPGEAMGLSFSVPRGTPIPPSLRNIYKCLCTRGLIKHMPTHGDLTYWAQQGVLLLNAALTTRIGESGAHPKWLSYTSAVIYGLAQREHPISFILLGADAQKLASLITKPHRVHTWGHPSPLSRANQRPGDDNFQNCTCFEAVNTDLVYLGEAPICWDPDGFLAQTAATIQPVTHTEPNEPPPAPVAVPLHAPFIYAPQPPPPTLELPAFKHDVWPDGTIAKTRRVLPADPQPSTGNVLYVFTDGGAYRNGYADCIASWACFITDGTTLTIASARVKPCELGEVYKTSNQRGELSAILHGLNYVESADVFVYTHIVVVSDSKYSIDCIESWAPKWRAKAAPRGQPVVDNAAFAKYKNTDLIFPALEVTGRLRARYTVEFKHQAAHQKIVPTDPVLRFMFKGNQIVDAACSLLLPQQ